jgi:hypothetical protein
VVPASILGDPAERASLIESIDANGRGYVFFRDKLGGEISVAGTPRSPEMAFDVTAVEVRPDGAGGFMAARYGVLEIQTMDYHGTYRMPSRIFEMGCGCTSRTSRSNFSAISRGGPAIASRGRTSRTFSSARSIGCC